MSSTGNGIDLSTTYLGLRLPHPLMPGASPLSDDIDTIRRLEDAGAAAIVLRSLFEEQIEGETRAVQRFIESHGESFAEALSYLPPVDEFAFGPEEYLAHLRRVKEAVGVPVIASLNGTSEGGWLGYARQMEEAGADALELNVYHVSTDPQVSGDAIEARFVSMLAAVKESVRIPVAMKLSPFYTSMANFAAALDSAGADGLVLFNRFYQPDIDIEELETRHSLELSHSSELLLRLRWLAILSGRIRASLAVTGGVHTATDALKAVMAGAHAVQMVSALLHGGPGHLRRVREEMAAWLEEHEYESLAQARGSMSLSRCPDPSAYERGNYMAILQTWRT